MAQEIMRKCDRPYQTRKFDLDEIFTLISYKLYVVAKRYMTVESSGHTLQAADLVNEAYLKLVHKKIHWRNQEHLFAIASSIMRHILVNHAKAKKCLKRGGNFSHVEFNDSLYACSDDILEIITIDDLLKQLWVFDRRACRILELSTFGGLARDEIALLENISTSTVDREVRTAKAWIISHLV